MSSKHQLYSNEVLHILSNDITTLRYLKLKLAKKATDKTKIPVGRNGSLEKYFEANRYNKETKVVIEIEAGRAVNNYQFLKDIFNVDYLSITVRNLYRKRKDFETVTNFLDGTIKYFV